MKFFISTNLIFCLPLGFHFCACKTELKADARWRSFCVVWENGNCPNEFCTGGDGGGDKWAIWNFIIILIILLYASDHTLSTTPLYT